MFGYDINLVKDYLYSIEASYNVVTAPDGTEMVYVQDKGIHDLVESNYQKYGNMYVPYIRISYHGGDGWYVRNNGLIEELTDEELKERIDYLTLGP